MLRISVKRAVLAATAAAFALSCGLAFVPAGDGAWAAPGDHKFINLRGRVADEAGSPIQDVRVEAFGTREGIALTNADGRFNLTLDLGTLAELNRRPVTLSVKARRAGYRIFVSGGAPELALELQISAEGGTPMLQARSNFGIIADALLEALAPPGERTAVIQVRYVAEPGIHRDSSVTLPAVPRSVPIAEPWAASEAAPPPAPARAADPAPPPAETAVVPPVRVEPKTPVVREEPKPPASPATRAPEVADTGAGTIEAPPATRAQPGRVKRATERRKEEVESTRDTPAPPARAAAILPPIPVRPTRADTLRLAREAEQRAAIAAAEARRDSAWRVQRASSLARKAVTDSARAIREAAEDSARRARFGLPPRPAATPRPAVPAVAAKPPPRSSETSKEAEREAKRAARDEKRAAKLRAADEAAARQHDTKDERRAAKLRAGDEAAARQHDTEDEERAAKLRAADERKAREHDLQDEKRVAHLRAEDERQAGRPAAAPETPQASPPTGLPRATVPPQSTAAPRSTAPPRATAPARSTVPPRATASEPARGETAPIAPTVGAPSATSGLRRVEPRSDQVPPPGVRPAALGLRGADSCWCVVRGTVEMEFHRLLTSPMRVEVSIRELPAMSDTIELFMGSPRAFEMTRVPCGRWSLAVRPFSERPFGVTTPEEVAPFDCRQRARRQVRIVLAPLRSAR